MKRNILFNISFSGKNYHGWQVQKNAITVQQVFEEALKKVIEEDFEIKGCSRTDSGVHANMYCLSVKIENKIPEDKLVFAINNYLPNDIVVNECTTVSNDFHARYNCKGKEYVYKIWNSRIRNPFLDGYVLNYGYPIDIEVLKESAKDYIGTHDFTSFCTKDNRKIENMTRTVKYFDITKEGNMIEMRVCADGFLYNMVRIMIGTLLRISQGKFSYDCIPQIMESLDRSKAGPTVIADGLYLNKVYYT